MDNLRDIIPFLLDIYGALLTDRQRDVLDLYYNDDLSLSEIADEIGISRQGVRELIKKAEDELLFFEEKLGLAARFRQAGEQAERLLGMLRERDADGEIMEAAENLAKLIR